jgi:sirohydrochlorin ferrochelatase
VIKTSKLETVSVNTEPYCRKAAGPGATGQADAVLRPNSPWLADKAVQEKLRVLDEELKPHAASLIGITFEDEPRTAVVVLYPGFTAYADLQAKLAPRVKPLPVVLRPGCHTAEALAEALEVLRARDWHPKAGTTPVGWHLDAASSAYAVVVDDSAPEVAEALRNRLDDRVLVTLGKPRRHALGAATSTSRSRP